MGDEPNGEGGKKKKGGSKQPQYAKDDQGNLILPPDMPEIDVVTWQVTPHYCCSPRFPPFCSNTS